MDMKHERTSCEIPSDYKQSRAKKTSLNFIGEFCALGESKQSIRIILREGSSI
jgi:hypothetical protein